MLIEKRSFFSGQNSDDDPKLLDDKSSLNIMNARMAISQNGRMGRLENFPGTTLVSQQVFPPYGTSQTIGTAIDYDNSRLLFFNYNTFEDHGIYCYDPAANNGAGKIYAVLYDSQVTGGLGFSRRSLIHSARVENGCLYWCDSTNNEPRRININAGIEMNHAGTFPAVTPYSWPMSQYVLYWIRRQPGLPLSIEKDTDGTYDNNFIKNEAFQFYWRYIYRDYETSTLSGLSTLANYNDFDDTFNFITVSASLNETIQQDVLQVDYVVKYLNGGKSFVFKSWNKDIPLDELAIYNHNNSSIPLSVDFYNDFTGIALDDAYSVKPFDSLPIYAQTIEMARFRSFMANYTIGYDTPTETSLTAAAFEQADSATASAPWVSVTYNGGLNTHYFLDVQGLDSGNGYYDVAPQPPPFPATVDIGLMTLVAVGPSNFALYLIATYPDFTGGFPATGNTSTLTGFPPVAGLAGGEAFKSGASYQVSVSFLDHAGRKCGILTNDDLKVEIGERVYSQINYTTFINWFLSNANAVDEIPEWAYYYSINITKCLTTRDFLQLRGSNITYATKDADDAYVFDTTAYSSTLKGVAIDITSLNSIGMGYTFAEGDLVKVYISSTVYNLSIVAQDGKWIICELKNLGVLGNLAGAKPDTLFEIYTPYKPSTSEPSFEVGQIYTITNPTTLSRQYSTIAGAIGGDITLLARNDGTDYLTENMSPNDKFPYQWNTDSGRPNFIDHIGQQVLTNSIAWSNTLIQGSKVNGLSTYDALDVKEVSLECGDITKLQVANKISNEQGTIMLSICMHQTASCYLGEVQLVGSQQNAFIASSPGVIGTVNILQGSFGTTLPESVFEYLGLVFFLDLHNGSEIQYSQSGLEPVSRYKMDRFFKNYCKDYLAATTNNLDNINGFHHIRSMVNPFTKEVLVTLPALIYENYANTLPSYTSVPSYATSIVDRFDIYDQLQKTMSFQFLENKWGSNYEWVAEWSDYLQNQHYSFKDGNLYITDSDTTNWNTVFGVQYPVRICCTGNLNPSLLKDLFNVAIEGNAAPDFSVAMANYPNEQITDLAVEDYDDVQGIFEAAWLMDRLAPNATGTADERLYTGDPLTDFAIYFMFEFQAYTELIYINFINLGYDASKGNQNIVNVINK